MSEQTARNILVIGGSSGIGKELVERLGRSGDHAIVASRGGGQRFDVTDRSQKLDLPDSLDGLVYMPGTINLKPFHRLSEEEFAHDMEVNFFGAVRVLQQALPALKRSAQPSAAVVLFSTVGATTGMPFHASTASAKAAVEGLGRSLAAEWAPKIRVNVIAPSLTNTPLAASFLSSEERVAAAAKRHPLEMIGDPADVAELVEFLIGSGSRFVTGQVWGVDGGLSSLHKF
jgi:NAD(P)-dependent dehydrogenase (short-subunit alcohol dehydrogenase family)